MFNERKAAQMAAYLLHKRGGTMSHLKLMKLLYLADREAMDRYGAPISGDLLVAMPHGPALSNTLNHMDGDVESSPGGWTDWISDQADYELMLRNPVSVEDLDELSEAELDVLDAVWEQFGSMGRWALRDYTHTHCPEWEDPRGSSNPIPYYRVFRALGRSLQDARALSDRIESHAKLDRLFAAL
ncbi:Panacea domain-containing protein [Candidatus Thiosymbion oneisti]|uniref:Panacea domain-containing protein n=1 Tax=Candidatus Thiosymbion oneisti TaxID=589554 RepID=UPI000A936BD5|nr:Panacea domain-containing protein [Candidatus Thiosymbion oneisti]